jgi:hypothetical protein
VQSFCRRGDVIAAPVDFPGVAQLLQFHGGLPE